MNDTVEVRCALSSQTTTTEMKKTIVVLSNFRAHLSCCNTKLLIFNSFYRGTNTENIYLFSDKKECNETRVTYECIVIRCFFPLLHVKSCIGCSDEATLFRVCACVCVPSKRVGSIVL